MHTTPVLAEQDRDVVDGIPVALTHSAATDADLELAGHQVLRLRRRLYPRNTERPG